MDLIAFMLVVWFVKVLAEDAMTQVKGGTNPRIERRRERRRSRANNPIWTQFVGWLGDVAEDARADAAESRRRRREKKRRRREQTEQKQVVGEPQQALPDPEVDVDLDDPNTPDPEKTASPPDPEPQQEPTAAEPAQDERPLAPVIPLFPTKEDLNMSTPTGEAPGLVHAIGFADAMEATYKNFATTGDTFAASLAQGEVSGEAVAAAARAREFERMAAAAWGECGGALKKQLAGKEFYNSTPGAGSKQFLTNE